MTEANADCANSERLESIEQQLNATRAALGLIIVALSTGKMPTPPPGLLEALGLQVVEAPRVLRPM